MENKISIGKINGTDIFAVSSESGETFVPIKPICEAVGVRFDTQYEKLQSHQILSSTIVLRGIVAADGKEREMVCLPLKYVYGWLFTINPRNVSDSARENVMRYQTECYDALYRHFFSRSSKQIESNQAELQELENLRQLLSEEKQIKAKINDTKSRIDKIRSSRLDDTPSLFD